MFDIKKAVEQLEATIQKKEFGKDPSNLYEPIRYIMRQEGKRVRPLLALISYQMFKDDYESIIEPALGVEVFHNFSLVHDDIMDKAKVRRGIPTVHKKWNENVAILSGDVMLVEAYDLFLKAEVKYIAQVIASFNDTARKVCEGQQFDMDFEEIDSVALDEYRYMIKCKTAVLLAFSLKLGGILAGAGEEEINALYDYGIHLGTAFQIKDDLLDTFGETAQVGKRIGGDILADKKTILMINALEHGSEDQKKKLESWFGVENQEEEKIEAVKTIFNEIGVKEIVEKELNLEYTKLDTCLDKISVDAERKEALVQLSQKLLKRQK